MLSAYALVLGINLAAMMFFNHAVPNADAEEYRGAFSLVNYLRPAVVFGLPTIVFFAGTAFAVGEWSRRPVAVFLLPVLIVSVEASSYGTGRRPGWIPASIVC